MPRKKARDLSQVRIWPGIYSDLQQIQIKRRRAKIFVPSLPEIVNDLLQQSMENLRQKWMPYEGKK